MNRPSKRQRKEDPPSWLQNQSLACVASPWGAPLRTKGATAHNKEIFLDRLQIEIIAPLKLNRQKTIKQETTSAETNTKTAVNKKTIRQKRVVMGANQCTRVLEKALRGKCQGPFPSLVVLARDVYPPTILSHIPVLAKQMKVPVLLLAGKASMELGEAIGTRRVSVVVFLEGDDANGDDDDSTSAKERKQIQSFIHFVKDTLLP